MAPRFIITATDTDVGKTLFAAGLTAALDGCYWKPVQAGIDGGTDTDRVRALSGLPADRFLPEAYRLALPASPHIAARREGITIDPDRLAIPPCDHPLVIEAAGGALVPLTDDVVYADLFARWQVPVIIVARTTLGTINHSLLTIEALRARQIPLLGIAFSGDAYPESEQTIVTLGKTKRLGRLPRLDPITPETLRAAFSSAFDMADFDRVDFA